MKRELELCFLIDLQPWIRENTAGTRTVYIRSVNILLMKLSHLSASAAATVYFFAGNSLCRHRLSFRQMQNEPGFLNARQLDLMCEGKELFNPAMKPLAWMIREIEKDDPSKPDTSRELHCFMISTSPRLPRPRENKDITSFASENDFRLFCIGHSVWDIRLMSEESWARGMQSYDNTYDEIRNCFDEIYYTVKDIINRFENNPLRVSGSDTDQWLTS